MADDMRTRVAWALAISAGYAIYGDFDKLPGNLQKLFLRRADAAIAAIPPPAPTGRTVNVRVAVSMDRDGDWVASGWKGATDAAAIDASARDVAAPVSVRWLTATLPVSEAVEVAAATETTKAP